MTKEQIIALIESIKTRRCKCPNHFCVARTEYDKAKGDIIAKILELKK